jgi:hypothetical protein
MQSFWFFWGVWWPARLKRKTQRGSTLTGQLALAAERNVWTAVDPAGGIGPKPRLGHTLAADPNGALYLHGGYNGPMLGDTWAFDPGTLPRTLDARGAERRFWA